MISFKPRANKKLNYNKKSGVTLDSKHKEYLNEFAKDDREILINRREISMLKKK